jgi:hypothetical protein
MGTAERLLALVDREAPRLRSLSPQAAARRPAPGKWSPLEVLGHMLDSAFNNHQRFVRGQLEPSVSLPDYRQEEWVRCQGYADADWAALIDLWISLNRHLARVIARIPAGALPHPVTLGDNAPVTLGHIVDHYLEHVEHHLKQIPA